MNAPADFIGLAYALAEIGAFAEAGWNALLPDIQSLISALVRLSIVMTMMAWVWRGSPDSVAEFFWMVVKLNVVLWIMNDFWNITQMIFDTMVAAGVATAPNLEGLVTADVIKDPGQVASLATVALTPLMTHIDTMLGPVDIFYYATELLFAYGAMIAGMAVFLVFGLLIFLATAEFYVMAIPAALMAPFIAWNKTAFIASPAIGYIVNSGIRLFGTSLAVVMGLAVMLAYSWPTEPTIQDSVNIMILTLAILGLGLRIFQFLGGLVNGGPVADVGSALGQLWTATRIGSAAHNEATQIGEGLTSGKGVAPRAIGGFVNGVRGVGTQNQQAIAGPTGQMGGGQGGLRGAFQRGMAGARANLQGGSPGSPASRTPPQPVAPSSPGGQTVPSATTGPASPSGIAQPVTPSAPASPNRAPTPNGFLMQAKNDMRDQESYYAQMATDPAVGPSVANSLRSVANRGTAVDTAQMVELTDPAKGQQMLSQINAIDGRVNRAIAAGRPPDIINQKSADEYRDVVLNA